MAIYKGKCPLGPNPQMKNFKLELGKLFNGIWRMKIGGEIFKKIIIVKRDLA